MRSPAALCAAGLLCVGALSGCAAATTCVSWVDYETVQAAYDDSTLVVSGTALPSTRTVSVFGLDVPQHEIAVDEVLKGEVDGTLLVAGAPQTCPGPGPDQLERDDAIILFLIHDAGTWRMITPYDGVVPLPADGTLPFAPD